MQYPVAAVKNIRQYEPTERRQRTTIITEAIIEFEEQQQRSISLETKARMKWVKFENKKVSKRLKTTANCIS